MSKRKLLALQLLQNGDVTVVEAAQIAHLSIWEFADLIKRLDVRWVKFTPEALWEAFKETSRKKMIKH